MPEHYWWAPPQGPGTNVAQAYARFARDYREGTHFCPTFDDYIPSGVRLTAYGGDAADLPTDVLQAYLDAVAAGRLTVPIHRTYTLDEIAEAHADMEHGRATGKLVVVP